jgi:motility quorum-sensing regulator/GCU-specific mRNA interferase toxin
MEKRIAHYPLSEIKALVEKGLLRVTKSALRGAATIGFGPQDIRDVIMNLETSNLHKSMTSHQDHRIWQDVYYVPIDDIDLYVKLQISG